MTRVSLRFLPTEYDFRQLIHQRIVYNPPFVCSGQCLLVIVHTICTAAFGSVAQRDFWSRRRFLHSADGTYAGDYIEGNLCSRCIRNFNLLKDLIEHTEEIKNANHLTAGLEKAVTHKGDGFTKSSTVQWESPNLSILLTEVCHAYEWCSKPYWVVNTHNHKCTSGSKKGTCVTQNVCACCRG